MVRSKKNPFKHPLVLVTWVDAETDHGWEGVEETDMTLPIATTVGFLIKEGSDKNGNDYYLLASTYSDTSTNGRFKIPKQMVKEIRML